MYGLTRVQGKQAHGGHCALVLLYKISKQVTLKENFKIVL